MKIKKCCKLVWNLYEKHNYVVHIRTLKQALNHGLVLKKLQKVIQFNQKAWFNPKTTGGSKVKLNPPPFLGKTTFKKPSLIRIKPYIDINTNLRKEAKNEWIS